MIPLLRILFILIVVKPIVLIVLGINVRHRERFPSKGPAIIIANHNSHLDTITLMSLFPLRRIPKVRPVAAADYFLKNALVAWFSEKIIGIIPIKRNHAGFSKEDPFAGCSAALKEGEILILFPEGSRGEPERISKFKKGIAHLAKRHPDVPVIPVFMHGLGKAMPKGEIILIPFFCDIFIGQEIYWHTDATDYMNRLEESMHNLAQKNHFPLWEEESAGSK